MDGCFPLFYLLTYFINVSPDCNYTPVTDTVCSVSYGSIAVRWRTVLLWKFSRILFFRKTYNPSNRWPWSLPRNAATPEMRFKYISSQCNSV